MAKWGHTFKAFIIIIIKKKKSYPLKIKQKNKQKISSR